MEDPLQAQRLKFAFESDKGLLGRFLVLLRMLSPVPMDAVALH